MANHLRRQIREAAATAVTGLATTGARVFQSRVYALAASDLPGLRISTRSESSAATTMGVPRLFERRLQLQVEAVAKAVADLDDTLDQICKEVEIALAMPGSFGGVAKTITLTGTDIGLSAEGDQPVGSATMTFEVLYITAENAPDIPR